MCFVPIAFSAICPRSAGSFDGIKSLSVYPRGTVLFREGLPRSGMFVLCEGRIKLSLCSESGKRLTLRIAGPGEKSWGLVHPVGHAVTK